MWSQLVFLTLYISVAIVTAGPPPATNLNNVLDDSMDTDDDVMCDPQLADSCFTDVEDDLRQIFDTNGNYARPTDVRLVVDLCSAWNDSLQCTSDIIDSECQDKDGRTKFDHWNLALRNTWQFVCAGDKQILKDFFRSIGCFNISGFFDCVETTANLRLIKDLMDIDLDATECRYLQKVVEKCGEYVTLGSCALGTLDPFNAIIGAFFRQATCQLPPSKLQSNSSPKTTTSCLTYSLLTLLMIYKSY